MHSLGAFLTSFHKPHPLITHDLSTIYPWLVHPLWAHGQNCAERAQTPTRSSLQEARTLPAVLPFPQPFTAPFHQRIFQVFYGEGVHYGKLPECLTLLIPLLTPLMRAFASFRLQFLWHPLCLTCRCCLSTANALPTGCFIQGMASREPGRLMKCFPSPMHLDFGQLRGAPPSVQVWHLSCPFSFYTVRLADGYGRGDPLHDACKISVLSISLLALIWEFSTASHLVTTRFC
jgi:hypothetical protein